MNHGFSPTRLGRGGVPAAREGVLTLLASAAALRERAPNHSESLCLSRDTADVCERP